MGGQIRTGPLGVEEQVQVLVAAHVLSLNGDSLEHCFLLQGYSDQIEVRPTKGKYNPQLGALVS